MNGDDGKYCVYCNNIVDKVYQYGACKKCLMPSMRRLQIIIDNFQGGENGKSSKLQKKTGCGDIL